jgi:pyruvate dehydrogenase E1 component beta subunit
VARTSRVIVLQEAARSIGAANTIVSLIAREGFSLLDAPVRVVAPPDTPVPYGANLEDAYLPSAAGLEEALEHLLAY